MYSLLSLPHAFLLFIFRLIFLYHLLYFISYLIAAHVLIPACFFNKLIHFCRINKVIIIIIFIFISTILQSGKFLNSAHYFPYDEKRRLFLANQKARNAIVGAENLLNVYIYVISKSMHALWLVNQLWFIVLANPWKNRSSSELWFTNSSLTRKEQFLSKHHNLTQIWKCNRHIEYVTKCRFLKIVMVK